MKKKLFISSLLAICAINSYAVDIVETDTLYTQLRNDLVILSTTKETNSLKSLPASVSVLSPQNLESMQIFSMKDLSSYAPNFFVPNYGSKMTTPVYIRGIGARTGSQTVSMYIDNVPYFNTSTFDIELYDVQRIEVLRGTQGTLYGRNAMGGIINVFTFSPLQHQASKALIGAGNYGSRFVNLSHSQKLKDNLGITASGYYRKSDGFFTNVYTGKPADDMESAGGRLKLNWMLSPRLQAQFSTNFDFVDQGAFPYKNVKTNEVSFDGESTYKRRLTTNGLSFQYTTPKYIVSSTTGYQYLNDDMRMDTDYSPLSVFTLHQSQNEHSLSQEVTIKSNSKSNYQWSNGVFGFYEHLKTVSPVYMLQDGITNILQKQMDKLESSIPGFPKLTYTDSQIDMNSAFRQPTYGAAIFHQSTLNNILYTKGLSLTVGMRLDYEKTSLDYDANIGTNLTMLGKYPGARPMKLRADSIMAGKVSTDFVELLPKFVLKYDISPASFMYVSASRGYKAGGHNIQTFANILEGALTGAIMNLSPSFPSGGKGASIEELVSYKPEYSWNYETGGQVDLIKNTLSTNFSLFYIDVQNLQITQFVEGGTGRMTTNAGSAVSKGVELGLKGRPCNGFYLYANYGFSYAKFKNYQSADGDFTHNFIPFAPTSTFSLGSSISYEFKNKALIDKVTFDPNFMGVGRIYWTEANDESQAFYGTLNARLLLDKGIFGVEFWGRNLLDRNYNSFFVKSLGNPLVQQGRPLEWGVTLHVNL